MKIIRASDNSVVYDNRRVVVSDDMDNADPMAISGGSINIQKIK